MELVRIVKCSKVPYNKTYLITEGGRREITSQAIKHYKWNNITIEHIDAKQLLSIPVNGGKVYGHLRGGYRKCQDNDQARSIFYSDLKGNGVEFGAATKPSPVPLNCRVFYADYYDEDTGCNAGYKKMGGEFVPVTYHTGLERLEGIPEESLDFIIHNHVLEHVADPIGAFEKAYKKLKKGGRLYFAVPNKRKTFDRLRMCTGVRHFKSDYYRPSKYRELRHVIAGTVLSDYSIEKLLQLPKVIKKGFWNGYKDMDYHHHMFTVHSLEKMLRWYNAEIGKWLSFEVVKGEYLKNTNEIYAKLIK